MTKVFEIVGKSSWCIKIGRMKRKVEVDFETLNITIWNDSFVRTGQQLAESARVLDDRKAHLAKLENDMLISNQKIFALEIYEYMTGIAVMVRALDVYLFLSFLNCVPLSSRLAKLKRKRSFFRKLKQNYPLRWHKSESLKMKPTRSRLKSKRFARPWKVWMKKSLRNKWVF